MSPITEKWNPEETGRLEGDQMANLEHLARLKDSVRKWNSWRKTNWDVYPDFREANLSKANLIEANLAKANLTEVNLTLSSLEEANLSMAKLSRAKLRGADLSGVDLSKAKINGADLSEANLDKSAGFRGGWPVKHDVNVLRLLPHTIR
jgi:uncharacterized protein YjbI with pentapeptide repeats